MQIERYDGSTEREVVTACIVNKTVLGRVASRWEGRGLCSSPWANIVVSLCVDFFKRYGDAPKKGIASLFREWAANQEDETTILLIESYLSHLSGEYERLETDVNAEYTISLAGSYFNRVRLTRLAESLQAHLAIGKVEDAETEMASYHRVEMGTRTGIDVLNDEEAVRSTFDREVHQNLVEYPGAAGRFFGRDFRRGAFALFVGREKVGKCLEGDAEILLSDGRVRKIRELVDEKTPIQVVSFNEDTLRFEASDVTGFWDNGEKECWEVVTRTGKQLVGTANHPLLTPDGWKTIQELAAGDYIAAAKNVGFFGTSRMRDEEVKFIAYMLADGCCVQGTGGMACAFTKEDSVLVGDFEAVCKSLGFSCRRKGITTQIRGGSREMLRRHGMTTRSKEKTIPDAIFSCPRDQVALFLRVFFSCDGSVPKALATGRRHIELTLASEGLLRGISHLLDRFGVVHRVYYKQASCRGKKFDSWRLYISSGEYVNLFLREIGLMSYKDIPPVEENTNKSFLDKLPPQVAERFYREAKDTFESGRCDPGSCDGQGFYATFGRSRLGSIRKQINKRLPIMRQSFSIFSGTQVFEKYMNSHILWDEIECIRPVGVRRTYDLTVPGHSNFVANGVVAHNSWFLLDVAWTASHPPNRRKVAFFQVGDLTETEIKERIYCRLKRKPFWPATVRAPVRITVRPGVGAVRAEAVLEYRERVFDAPLGFAETWEEAKWDVEENLRSRSSLFRLLVSPNYTMSVDDIKDQIAAWKREDWMPDVVVIDYFDVLCPPRGEKDFRQGLNRNWMALRTLSQELNVLVVTATQADADSYNRWVLTMSNFNNDKRVWSHVTSAYGINATEKEMTDQVYRLNQILAREREHHTRMLWTGACLAIANPCVVSTLGAGGEGRD